jgi:hypothetical protein
MSENGTATLNDLANAKAALSQARAKLKQWRALLGVDSFDDVEPKLRELKESAGKVAEMTGKLADLETRAGKPDEKDKLVADLRGQIRQRDFRDAFKAAAGEAGVNPKRAEKLLKLSDLAPPDEGEIGPELFAEYLASAKTADAWAFGETPSEAAPVSGGTSQGIGGPASQPPPGAGRSASAPSVGQVRYTSADINTPGWQQSRPELVAALKSGTAVRAD